MGGSGTKIKTKNAANSDWASEADRLGPVAIVEINERQSQHTPDKIIEAAS